MSCELMFSANYGTSLHDGSRRNADPGSARNSPALPRQGACHHIPIDGALSNAVRITSVKSSNRR
jgi:hypothetical protein